MFYTNIKEYSKKDEVKKHLDFLNHKIYWFQIFKPDINGKRQEEILYQEFTTEKEKILKLCDTYNGDGLLCVAINERPPNKTLGKDVKQIDVLFFDVDVKRELKQNYVSTEEHHEHAIKTAKEKIKPFLESLGFNIDLILDSGNGSQLFCKVKINVSNQEKLDDFKNKIIELELQLKKFNDNIVKIDSISKDLNRRVKLAGTINKKDTAQKENRYSTIIYQNHLIDEEKNNEAFKKIKPKTEIINVNELTKIRTNEIKNKEEIKKIIEKTPELKQLLFFDGVKKFPSRSEAEFKLLILLMEQDITDYETIDEIMKVSKTEKWGDEREQYRKLTYEKALEEFQKKTPLKKKIIMEEYKGITTFHNPSRIYNQGIIYTQLKETTYEDRTYYVEEEYRLYLLKLGEGNRPKLLKTKHKIDEGDRKIYFKKISLEDTKTILNQMTYEGILKICNRKILNIDITKGEGPQRKTRPKNELTEEIIEKEQNFLEPALAINPNELKTITNHLELIKEIIKENITQIDEDLLLFYIADLPEPEPTLIKPASYMDFAPHKIIITNSRVGKTSIARRIIDEPLDEKPSEAGLLGSSNMNGKIEGTLHGRIKQSYLDEVQEEKGDELLGKLHSYMVSGEMKTSKVGGVICIGYSGLTFQGNPKTKENTEGTLTDFYMIKQFTDFLNKISSNTNPFSRRIGLTIFDKNLPTIKGIGKPDEEIQEKGNAIIRTIAEAFRPEFTKLFHNKKIKNWLNIEYKEDYKKVIKELLKDVTETKIRDFLEGSLNAHTHSKGIALRLAWLEKGIHSNITQGRTDINLLIETAENYLDLIQKRNIKSYRNILNSSSHTEEALKEFNLKSIKPEYLKLCVFTLLEWFTHNKETKEALIPITLIEPYFKEVKQKLGIGEQHTYRSFAKIINKLNGSDYNFSKILEDFFIDYDKHKSCFIITNKAYFLDYSNTYKKIYI